MRNQYGIEIHIYEVDPSAITKRLGGFSYVVHRSYAESTKDLHRGVGFNLFWLGISVGLIKFKI